MAPLKILIVGAGIGGSAIAFWLSKLGHDVTVVERSSIDHVNGLQLDLRGQGITAMRRMGIDAEIKAKCVPEAGFAIIDGKGRRRAYFPANAAGKTQTMTSEYEILRSDLCQVLRDASGGRVKYVFSTSIESFEEVKVKDTDDESREKTTLLVRLNNGETMHVDLIVGADGLGSRTRKLMLGPNAPNPLRSTGNYTAYFTAPIPNRDGAKFIADAYMAKNDVFFLTRRHNASTMQIYLKSKAASDSLKTSKTRDVQEQKKAFAEGLQGTGWESKMFEEKLWAASDFYCQSEGVIELDSWSSGGCVTLLGDAGYGAPPNGWGTSCALVGAYVLAGEITKYCGTASADGKGETKKTEVTGARRETGLPEALQSYEKIMRPLVDGLQKGHREPKSGHKIPRTDFTFEMAYKAMWLASKVRLDLLIAKFIPEGGNNWKMPEYEELKF